MGDSLASALRTACDFIAVGTAVCEHARSAHRLEAAVILFDPRGRPLLYVDNLDASADEARIRFFRNSWETLFATYAPLLQENPVPIGDERIPSHVGMTHARDAGYMGSSRYSLVVPLFEPSGMFGWILFAAPAPFVDGLRQALVVVGHHVSVRLAQLGLRSQPSAIHRLTRRQFEVAQLAARGSTNAAISIALDMSENTVKKHLKDIFERLSVGNRAELAAQFASSPPREEVPRGISHRGGVTIMRFE